MYFGHHETNRYLVYNVCTQLGFIRGWFRQPTPSPTPKLNSKKNLKSQRLNVFANHSQ